MPVAVCSSCGYMIDNPPQLCPLCGEAPDMAPFPVATPDYSRLRATPRNNSRKKTTAVVSCVVIIFLASVFGVGFCWIKQIEFNIATAPGSSQDDLIARAIAQLEQYRAQAEAEAAVAAEAAKNDAVLASEVDASEIILSFIGDCTLGDNYYSSRFASYYDRYGSDYFFSGVWSILSNDDLSIANCEGTFTAQTTRVDKIGERNFWFRGKPEYAEIFQKGSVEVVNLANNHTLDYGRTGYLDTKANLKRYGIDYFGNEEILIKEIRGIKIGFYGLYFGYITVNAIKERIQRLQELKADIIVGTFHTGNENQYTPTNFQVYIADQAVLLGTDIVIQHHPHVIQDIVWHSENKLIAYSLGNFCFGGNANPRDKRSLILRVKIDANLDLTYETIPVLISGRSDVNDYRPVLYP